MTLMVALYVITVAWSSCLLIALGSPRARCHCRPLSGAPVEHSVTLMEALCVIIAARSSCLLIALGSPSA